MARDGYCHEVVVPAAALSCSRRSGAGSPALVPSPRCWHGCFFWGGEKPTSPRKVLPLGGLQQRGRLGSGCLASSRVLLGVLHQLGGMRALGRTLSCRKGAGGGLAAPNVGKGQPGAGGEAARELARPQQPSSRGGGVVAHSLQPNHPSFIANSSPQARMGFFFSPFL